MPTCPGDVLALIRAGEATTRGALLEQTGLSRMTLSRRVDTLLSAGLVVDDGGAGTSSGRRARLLRFHADHARVLAVAVDTTHARIALTDLLAQPVAAEEITLDVTDGPAPTLAAITAAATALLERTGTPVSSVCGFGLSIPGPVDPLTGRTNQPPMMPGWDGYPMADEVAAALPGIPVLTANDADAAAIGEERSRPSTTRAMCLLKVATGIGTGIIIDGRPYRGLDGGAGDIGHVRLRDHPDALCQCGARGCLAAVASGRAVAAKLRERGIPAQSGRDVGRLVAHGNADADQLTREAGQLIGEVLATVVCVLNPEVVVVGGAMSSAPLLAGLRETLYRLTPARATRHLTLEMGRLGDDAAVVGLAHAVVDEVFSAAAVNARLGA